MEYSFEKSLQVLECTPAVLRSFLQGLDDSWLKNNEGPDTWSPYDVVGHLLHGENNDWIPRIKITLANNDGRFSPFNRTAMFEESLGKTTLQLLDEFEMARKNSLEVLKAMNISPADLDKTAIHPSFGRVTLRQLLATWVAHDLGHIVQVSRTMARQYKEEIGPWREYLSVMA